MPLSLWRHAHVGSGTRWRTLRRDDEIGGVGTPTSDNERTKITLETTRMAVLINGYDGDETRVRQNAEFILDLVAKYCQAQNGRYFVYR